MLIKMKLLELGKRQIDLLPELSKRGVTTSAAELSRAINNTDSYPKISRIREACLEILDEWKEAKGNGVQETG